MGCWLSAVAAHPACGGVPLKNRQQRAIFGSRLGAAFRIPQGGLQLRIHFPRHLLPFLIRIHSLGCQVRISIAAAGRGSDSSWRTSRRLVRLVIDERVTRQPRHLHADQAWAVPAADLLDHRCDQLAGLHRIAAVAVVDAQVVVAGQVGGDIAAGRLHVGRDG